MRVLAALAVLLFPITVHAESLTGYYEITKPNGIVIPDGEGEICDTELSMEQTCVQSIETKDVLGLKEVEDGSLQFSSHLSFFNGHSCAISGMAIKDGNGWLFTENLPLGENGEDIECTLSISAQDGIIVMNGSNECRAYYCGMRGHLSHIKFPLSSKVSDTISDRDLKCIGIYSDECQDE